MDDHEMKHYSILVNTTDSFEDCWYPFFKLFKQYWPSYKGKIYLNTETKKYAYDDFNIVSIQNNIINSSVKNTWSRCLLKALDKIESDIILYLQEDYFIKDVVDTGKIDYLLNIMREEDYSNIHLTDFSTPGPFKASAYQLLWEVGKKAPYRISTQAALWKKKALRKYLRRHESAWEFEKFGSKRAHYKKDSFFCINREYFKNNSPMIDYVATGIIKGRWNKEVFRLFKENGIGIDYEKRGFFEVNGTANMSRLRKYCSKNTFRNWFYLGYDILKEFLASNQSVDR